MHEHIGDAEPGGAGGGGERQRAGKETRGELPSNIPTLGTPEHGNTRESRLRSSSSLIKP